MMPKHKPTPEQIAAEVAAFDSKPDCSFVDLSVICALRKRSRASTYRDIKRGLAPAPKKFGNSSRWRVGDVRAWLNK